MQLAFRVLDRYGDSELDNEIPQHGDEGHMEVLWSPSIITGCTEDKHRVLKGGGMKRRSSQLEKILLMKSLELANRIDRQCVTLTQINVEKQRIPPTVALLCSVTQL